MKPSKVVVAWSLAGVCLAVSLLVQGLLLTRAPFHEDEAFYTAYSKDILHGQPFLTSKGVEKPPVFFYWQALFMAIGGESQAAARLPNVAAFLIAVIFAFRLSRRVYDDFTAGVIVVVLSLSPFYVLFGPTAFTDMIAVTLAIGSLERLSAKKWFWAGVLAAGSMFSKQYFGLYLGYGVLAMAMIPGLRPNRAEAKQWVTGIVCASLPVLFWTTFLNYPIWNIARFPKEIYHTWDVEISRWTSLRAWIVQCGHVLGSPVLSGIVVATVPFLFWETKRDPAAAQNEKVRWDFYWLLVAASYIAALSWQRNVPHYERYILVVVIPICILAGRVFASSLQRLPRFGAIPMSILLFFLLGHSFYTKVWRGGYKYGGNYDVNVGLAKAFDYTNQHFPSTDGLVAFEASSFLTRYYAYRSPHAIHTTVTQDQLFQRFREYAFSPIWLLVNDAYPSLVFEKWPKDVSSLWAPRKLFEEGHFQVWELLPSERFKNLSIAPQALSAALQRLWKQPVEVRRMSGTRFEVRGPFPVREGIMASFSSVWSGVEVYSNQTWMTGRIQETATTFELKTDAAVASLSQHNRNIAGLLIRVASENEIVIEGTNTKPRIPFRVVLRPQIVPGNKMGVELRGLSAGRVRMPEWLCRWVSHQIPPQKLGLPHWAGEAVAVQLWPEQQAVVITARKDR